ncbi:MAG: efflux RND transporter periplasmic adaptor subunit [Variibacter sp.]|nr:efflux RND transporter periplasmic adaptor subunit [Variibacter sp.]
MSTLRTLLVLALGAGLGAAGQAWYAQRAPSASGPLLQAPAAGASERAILYYRDPSGAPLWSATPKKDAAGRDYLPVYDDEEISFDPKPPPAKAASRERRILYYRNPMGLPDTSPVPKKDAMGMDYIPVYEDEEADDGKTVKVSLDRVQRSGVRTEPVEHRVLVRPVRGVGTVAIDESRLTVVALRADGYIEDLFVNTTGRSVRAGEPLFRLYSPQIQQAQIDLLVAVGAVRRGVVGAEADRALNGAMQRLRNLGVPESRIREVRETGANPRTLDWPAPAAGTVISKRVINGQRVAAGDELYRIADLSTMWVIADVAEADLALIKPGTRALVTFRAYPTEPVEGTVSLIYPEVKTETRTARVRLEVPNPDGRLKADMYADVVFRIGADEAPVLAVPDGAVIDSGTRQVVLVSRGEGRFEPRAVTLGRRGEGYREVLAGLQAGEEVVTTAAFLIDAESNLRAALNTFTREPDGRKPADAAKEDDGRKEAAR